MTVDVLTITTTAMLSAILTWSAYNLLALLSGLTHRRESVNCPEGLNETPSVSVLIPAKNEEAVIGRCLEFLLEQDYPAQRMEILVIEDGSSDRTVEIVEEYAARHSNVKLLRKPDSGGKPAALNYGLKFASGELVAVFDADSIVEPRAIAKAVQHFADPKVAAVQGACPPVNLDEGVLAGFAGIQLELWYESYLRGKSRLGLFIPLAGSCQFIRRDVLELLGGFREDALAEDADLAARLVEEGYKVVYDPDVRAWQEVPSSLRAFVRQRVRWHAGWAQTWVRHLKSLMRAGKIGLDALATLLSPFMLAACFITYLLIPAYVIVGGSATPALNVLGAALTASAVAVVGSTGLTLIRSPNPGRRVLWLLPLVPLYWVLQNAVAVLALVRLAVGRVSWEKTPKTGAVTAFGSL